MAKAIAESLIARRASTQTVITVDSAGVAASDGHPATSEAVEALNERGIDLGGHQSKGLTAAVAARADLILAMTPSHIQGVAFHAPEAQGKVSLLNPNHPIGDPFGQPIEVYRDVADELERLIHTKIEEICS